MAIFTAWQQQTACAWGGEEKKEVVKGEKDKTMGPPTTRLESTHLLPPMD